MIPNLVQIIGAKIEFLGVLMLSFISADFMY